MIVGVNTAVELKEESDKRGIPFSDLLHAYLIEDFMLRLLNTAFFKYLLLFEEDQQPIEKIAFSGKNRLDFYYIEASHRGGSEKLEAGQPFSEELLALFLRELCEKQAKFSEVHWEYEIDHSQSEDGEKSCQINFAGEYREMLVPLTVKIQPLAERNIKSEQCEAALILHPEKTYTYYIYSSENRIGEYVFEIMKKLELISEMKNYYILNEILKTRAISGRNIMEKLEIYEKEEPKIVKIKRLEQFQEYKDYSYMRKKWNQYCKSNNKEPEAWEEVHGRIAKFIEPLWECLCRNEIFFDDWMPELGRFLG